MKCLTQFMPKYILMNISSFRKEKKVLRNPHFKFFFVNLSACIPTQQRYMKNRKITKINMRFINNQWLQSLKKCSCQNLTSSIVRKVQRKNDDIDSTSMSRPLCGLSYMESRSLFASWNLKHYDLFRLHYILLRIWWNWNSQCTLTRSFILCQRPNKQPYRLN